MYMFASGRRRQQRQVYQGELQSMSSYASAPDFYELSSYIIEKRKSLEPLAAEWADLARRAVQGLHYNRHRFADLEIRINNLRPELRRAVLVASEHFTDRQLRQLQRRAKISKTGWRALRKDALLTLKNGFSLMVY